MTNFFKRSANRLCVFIPRYGFVPVACRERDDTPKIIAGNPKLVGDDCVVEAEGKARNARLLAGQNGGLFLVDMGPAKGWATVLGARAVMCLAGSTRDRQLRAD